MILLEYSIRFVLSWSLSDFIYFERFIFFSKVESASRGPWNSCGTVCNCCHLAVCFQTFFFFSFFISEELRLEKLRTIQNELVYSVFDYLSMRFDHHQNLERFKPSLHRWLVGSIWRSWRRGCKWPGRLRRIRIRHRQKRCRFGWFVGHRIGWRWPSEDLHYRPKPKLCFQMIV